MSKFRVVCAIAFLLLLNACAFSAPTRTATPPFSTSTNEIIPTTTEGSLTIEGPWLIIIDDNQTYVANRDGTCLTPLLSGVSAWQVAISPTSNMVAVATYKQRRLNELTLFLFNLPDKNIKREISLLSFFTKQPKSFDNDESTGPWYGINDNIQWSPDGRYLAFMGAIESPSSSLYVYDSHKDVIKRLSQNTYQAANPTCSPNGQWIIFEGVSNFQGPVTEGIWAATPDGTQLKLLYKPIDYAQQEILDWVGNDNFVVVDKSYAIVQGNIRIVNLETGNVVMLYAGSYLNVSLDTKHAAVAFSPWSGAPGAGLNLEGGIYLVSPEITKPKLISLADGGPWATWDSETELFISSIECKNISGSVIAFNSSGDTSCVPKPEPKLDMSPDGQWYIVESDGLNVYRADGEILGTISEITNGSTNWRPDSQGFFVETKETLFYVSLPDLIVHIVYQTKNEFFYTTWVGVH